MLTLPHVGIHAYVRRNLLRLESYTEYKLHKEILFLKFNIDRLISDIIRLNVPLCTLFAINSST